MADFPGGAREVPGKSSGPRHGAPRRAPRREEEKREEGGEREGKKRRASVQGPTRELCAAAAQHGRSGRGLPGAGGRAGGRAGACASRVRASSGVQSCVRRSACSKARARALPQVRTRVARGCHAHPHADAGACRRAHSAWAHATLVRMHARCPRACTCSCSALALARTRSARRRACMRDDVAGPGPAC